MTTLLTKSCAARAPTKKKVKVPMAKCVPGFQKLSFFPTTSKAKSSAQVCCKSWTSKPAKSGATLFFFFMFCLWVWGLMTRRYRLELALVSSLIHAHKSATPLRLEDLHAALQQLHVLGGIVPVSRVLCKPYIYFNRSMLGYKLGCSLPLGPRTRSSASNI